MFAVYQRIIYLCKRIRTRFANAIILKHSPCETNIIIFMYLMEMLSLTFFT